MIKIKEFFESNTSTFTYLVYDEKTGDAVIIDPILNYNPETEKLSEASYSELKAFIEKNNLKPQLSFETHIHADHITASKQLKRDFKDLKLASMKMLD